MRSRCYLRKFQVIIPTMARTTDGIYVVIEPVSVISVEQTEELKQSFAETFARGNPGIPTPDFATRAPILMRYAGVKTWSTFERGTTTWSIDLSDGLYEIASYRRRPDRGWEQDPDGIIALPPDSTADQACARIVEIIQRKARE